MTHAKWTQPSGRQTLWVCLLVLVWGAPRGWGAPQPDIPPAMRANFVRVECVRQRIMGTGHSWGSGTYLGEQLVLTCHHVIRGDAGDGRIVTVRVYFPDLGVWTSATIAKEDRLWDQALLRLDDAPPAPANGVAISDCDATTGTPVALGGFSTGRLGMKRGTVIGFCSPAGVNTPGWLEIDQPSHSGDSGGPVIDLTAGRLVGNLWGSKGRQTAALTSWRTRQFLGNLCPSCPPTTSAPPMLRPSAPQTSAPPQTVRIDLSAIIAALRTDQTFLTAIRQDLRADQELLALLRGPQGPQGPPGTPGAIPDISDVQARMDALVVQLEQSNAVIGELTGRLDRAEQTATQAAGLAIARLDVDASGRITAVYANGQEIQVGTMPAQPTNPPEGTGSTGGLFYEIVPKGTNHGRR